MMSHNNLGRNCFIDPIQAVINLVSADFLASDYCHDIEMKRAIERHKSGFAKVIPIILRPVDWRGSAFSFLQALPKDALPVTSWPSLDEAFANTAAGIRDACTSLLNRDSFARTHHDQVRLLDGAVAAEVPQGVAREVVAMVCRPGSPGLTEVLRTEEKLVMKERSYSALARDVRSSGVFEIPFPVVQGEPAGPTTLILRVRAIDLDFSEGDKIIVIPAAADSQVHSFLFRSMSLGIHKLVLELVTDDAVLAARLLSTETKMHGGPLRRLRELTQPYFPRLTRAF